MGALVLAGRLVLAALFFTAAVGKLADLDGSREAAAGFGLPARLAAPVGTLVPLAELAVAIALIPVDAAPYAAIGAALLLLAFTAGIGRAIARGEQPDCHCFGQIHSAPAGPRTLARNLGLLALAGFVIGAGLADRGPSATHWIARLPAAAAIAIPAGLIILALFAFTVWFALQLLAQNGRIVQRLDALERAVSGMAGGQAPGLFAGLPGDLGAAAVAPAGFEDVGPLGAGLGDAGLPVGSPAPDFRLPDAEDHPVALADLLAPGPSGRRPLLLVFSDAGCGPCAALMPDLAGWQAVHRERLAIAVVAAGDRAANLAKAREHGLAPLLLETGGRPVAESYGASGTPMAVLVSPDATILSPAVGGAEAIETLVGRASALPLADAPRLEIHHAGPAGTAAVRAAGPGDAAPALQLPDLDGRTVDLHELLAPRTLALFWNPDCGFCQRMLPALQELAGRPDRPEIVVLAAGDAERTRAQGLRLPTLHDPHAAAQAAFGADGTPMAVLIEDGRVASSIAIGADAVLALADTRAGV